MNNRNTLHRLFEFASSCKDLLLSSVVFAVLGAGFGIVPYIAVSRIVIQICIGDYSLKTIIPMAVIALLGYLLQLGFSTISTMRSHKAAFNVLKNIRTALTKKLSRVTMGLVMDTPSGEFKTMLVDTIEKLELPLAHMIPELTANILIPVLMLIYFMFLDWRLALIALATFPVGMLCYMGMMKDYENRYDRVIKAAKAMDSATVEYIGGIEVIKTFNQSRNSYHKYVEAVKENEYSKTEWFKKTNPYYAAGIAIAPSSLLGVLPIGSLFYISGSISASSFISCIILSLGLIAPLIQALRYTDGLAMVDAIIKEISSLLDMEEMERPEKRVQLKGEKIELSNVSFSYKDTEVLHSISFEANENEMTALVGPSGSGKTTVARLIASFWNVGSGTVKLGGVDVQNIPLSQIMEHIAYVSQDNYLFHLSVRENIRIGKPNATNKEIENAAKKAACHDFIESLPNGYDTLVGDSGSNLSGGEKQRIAIARAILKNSPIVILDEATAFTDPENESIIQHSIDELVVGKTLIVIAHRLSTITSANKIIVMNEGNIEAEGKHEELIQNCILYRELWNAHISALDIKEASI